MSVESRNDGVGVESRNDGVGVESARILESLVRFSGGIKREIRTKIFESREIAI